MIRSLFFNPETLSQKYCYCRVIQKTRTLKVLPIFLTAIFELPKLFIAFWRHRSYNKCHWKCLTSVKIQNFDQYCHNRLNSKRGKLKSTRFLKSLNSTKMLLDIGRIEDHRTSYFCWCLFQSIRSSSLCYINWPWRLSNFKHSLFKIVSLPYRQKTRKT